MMNPLHDSFENIFLCFDDDVITGHPFHDLLCIKIKEIISFHNSTKIWHDKLQAFFL